MKLFISKCLLSASLIIAPIYSHANPELLSDNEIKTEIIRDYLANFILFTVPCPCPELKATDDSRCGTRSAWSRKPGSGILCYFDDVKPEMIELWRNKNAESKDVKKKAKNRKEINIDNKVSEYLDKHASSKEINPDEINFKGLSIDDSKTPAN